MNTDQIDPDQLRVIEADVTARMLVHAGPGTGKTQVSALRLAGLIKGGVRPAGILVLSFSRSAVRTLARRLESPEVGAENVVEELRHLSIRTFDAWTFRLLRQLGAAPADLMARSHDQNIQLLVDKITGDGRDAVRTLLDGVRHVIIDEFQDLPGVRGYLVLALLNLIAAPDRPGTGFTVLGDPAQGIYEFATQGEEGSSEAFHDRWAELRKMYGKSLAEVTLRKNYRAAEGLAAITAKLREVLTGELDGAGKLAEMRAFVASLPPATTPLSPEWLGCAPPGKVAILARTNGQAVRVAQALLGRAVEAPVIPVSLQLATRIAVVPGWIAALLSPLQTQTLLRSQFERIHTAWLKKHGERTAQSMGMPAAHVAWQRLIRAAGLSDAETALSMEELRKRLDWPDAFPDDQALDDASVFITTIHQAKGMEFDSVCLLDRHEEDRDETGGSAREEASICFVGVTRAKTNLGVIPGDHIYKPPTRWKFRGRTRLGSWGKMVNLEMGLPGDIDLTSFVDTNLLSSSGGPVGVQQLLMSEASHLEGHKVMLCKARVSEESRNVTYHLHLQEGDAPGRLIGAMSQQLVRDLLELLYKKGYSLPSRIMNLRISSVITLAGPDELSTSVPDPYRTSRLWLGVSLAGTGDFLPYKRGTKK